MTVRELIDKLSACRPDAPVLIERTGWAMGSSETGAYETGPHTDEVRECNDLETRVVLVFEE